MVNKSALRRRLLTERAALDNDLRARWDARIEEELLAWWHANQVRTLGVFWPIRQEPDLRTAYSILARLGAQLALPVVIQKDLPLQFAEWKPGDELKKDSYGVSVPATQQVTQPDALLIPCVGFNEQRFRLGYGGGFYDRTLAAMPRPRTIGIAYSCSRTSFEASAHDVALDLIITERAIL